MKSLTSKFVLALLSLVLTGAALSVGVYAWFTINNRVSVEAFSGRVEGGEGLLISLDGTTWSGYIESEDIQTIIDNSTFERFGEMTSSNGFDFTQRDGTTAVNSGFISFDLWFLGTEAIDAIQVIDVTITSEGATSFPSEIDGSPMTNHAANAARVSIVKLDTSDEEVSAVAFEQAEGVNGNTLGEGTFSSNLAVTYYNQVANLAGSPLTPIVETDFNSANPITPVPRTGTTFAPVTVTNVVNELSSSPITGQENFTKQFKVRVFVWIEGWDQEAYNAILSGSFNVSLGFEGVTTP